MTTDSSLQLLSTLKPQVCHVLLAISTPDTLQAPMHWPCGPITSQALLFPQKPKHLVSVASHAHPSTSNQSTALVDMYFAAPRFG